MQTKRKISNGQLEMKSKKLNANSVAEIKYATSKYYSVSTQFTCTIFSTFVIENSEKGRQKSQSNCIDR